MALVDDLIYQVQALLQSLQDVKRELENSHRHTTNRTRGRSRSAISSIRPAVNDLVHKSLSDIIMNANALMQRLPTEVQCVIEQANTQEQSATTSSPPKHALSASYAAAQPRPVSQTTRALSSVPTILSPSEAEKSLNNAGATQRVES
jgi:hypothetical protein